MPVRITILSGSRQGEILETDQHVVVVGDLPSDDVAFDSLRDAEIRDRRATLKLDGDRWSIHNAGAKPIFVNHDVVTTTQSLRSGDIVRMSHDGPDFSFDLISSLSKSPAKVPAENKSVPKTAPAKPKAAAQQVPTQIPKAADDASLQPAWPVDRRITIAGSLALIAIFSAWAFWPDQNTGRDPDPLRLQPPRLGSFPVLRFNEGENIWWKPPLAGNTPDEESLRYKFVGDVPPGMTIDAITGEIQWQTGEDDGPRQFRCTVMVYLDHAGDSASDTATLEIQIKEVNQQPVPARLATHRVNLRDGDELRVQLRAEDPDAPAQKLSFHLKPEAPDSVTLDPDTGQMVWKIGPEFANREVTIPYRVTDDAIDPASSDGIVRVRIDLPDPWTVAENELRECVYLLVAQTKPGDSILPLGTACAIDAHTLLSSATVASGANDAVSRGWKIFAVDTRNFRLEDFRGIEVTQIRSHAGYVHAANPVEQAYFDLALLTCSEELPAHCKLGDVEASASNGQELGCFGFEIYSGSLTRFDNPRPKLAMTRLLEVIPPPNQTTIPGRQPYLLQLIGDLPFQLYGSLVVNDKAEVLGIYAFRGRLPKDAPPTPIHYAPDVVLASAFLAGQGHSLWVVSEESQAEGKGDPK